MGVEEGLHRLHLTLHTPHQTIFSFWENLTALTLGGILPLHTSSLQVSAEHLCTLFGGGRRRRLTHLPAPHSALTWESLSGEHRSLGTSLRLHTPATYLFLHGWWKAHTTPMHRAKASLHSSAPAHCLGRGDHTCLTGQGGGLFCT